MNSKTMKAVIVTKYGSPEVLELKEVAKPTPKDNEVLIKINATAVTTADSMMRRADPYISRFFLGFNRPKKPIIGTGMAGEIEAIGKDVTLFKVGDQVFGLTGLNFSANAEYVCLDEQGVLVHKPTNMTFEEAAPVCDGALTSFNFLRDIANVQPGQKVLINGASGSLGTSAIQLAKLFGAKVTGVCGPKNLNMVTALGADYVIDYHKEDFTKNGQTYDVIFDTVGKSSFSKCKNSLTENGQYLSPVLTVPLLFQMMGTSLFGTKKAKFSATGIRPVPELRALLGELTELFKAGEITSVMDRVYSLTQVVDAHRYVDSGHKRGNIAIKVA